MLISNGAHTFGAWFQQLLPMLWSYTPSITIVSYTSNVLQTILFPPMEAIVKTPCKQPGSSLKRIPYNPAIFPLCTASLAMDHTVEARKLVYDRPLTPKQRRNTSMNHTRSTFQLFGVYIHIYIHIHIYICVYMFLEHSTSLGHSKALEMPGVSPEALRAGKGSLKGDFRVPLKGFGGM